MIQNEIKLNEMKRNEILNKWLRHNIYRVLLFTILYRAIRRKETIQSALG